MEAELKLQWQRLQTNLAAEAKWETNVEVITGHFTNIVQETTSLLDENRFLYHRKCYGWHKQILDVSQKLKYIDTLIGHWQWLRSVAAKEIDDLKEALEWYVEREKQMDDESVPLSQKA